MLPRLYDDITPENLAQRVFDAPEVKALAVDTQEGSYTQSVVGPMALEMWKAYQSFNSIEPMIRVDETSGPYLLKECEAYGIERKPGARAQVASLVFTGTNGTVVPAGKVVLTEDGLQFVTKAAVTLTGEQATVAAEAVEVGERYNVEPGAIVRQFTSTPGVRTVTNTDAATGGADPEAMASLFARLDARRKNPNTSGNRYHYEEWARSVDGVGDAKCIPLVNGPGTVGVLIVGPDRQPVDEATRARCHEYIDTQCPVCVATQVASAEALVINVSARVNVAEGTTQEVAKAKFTQALDAYLKSISFAQYTIPYTRIGWLLAGIDGVVDYAELKVNDSDANVAVPEDAVPVLGMVSFT